MTFYVSSLTVGFLLWLLLSSFVVVFPLAVAWSLSSVSGIITGIMELPKDQFEMRGMQQIETRKCVSEFGGEETQWLLYMAVVW